MKVSYSCTENMKKIIDSHNKNVINPQKTNTLPCNCRNKNECPLNGNCRQSNVLYKCVASTPNEPDKTYIGITEREFKTRYYEQIHSFKHRNHESDTELSKYVWKIKDKHKRMPSLKWSIIKSIPSYSNTTKKCPLCLHEKFHIINYPDEDELLNKKSELISKCRHENKFLLANYKSKD